MVSNYCATGMKFEVDNTTRLTNAAVGKTYIDTAKILHLSSSEE